MKRILISLMVILMAFSLFVSCEVNKTPDKPKEEATEGKTTFTKDDFAPVLTANTVAKNDIDDKANSLVKENEAMNLTATFKTSDGSPIVLDSNTKNKYDSISLSLNYNHNQESESGKYYYETTEVANLKYHINGETEDRTCNLSDASDLLYRDLMNIINSNSVRKYLDGSATESEIIDIDGIVNMLASNNPKATFVINIEIKTYAKSTDLTPTYTFKANVELSIKNGMLSVRGYLKGEKDLDFYIELDLSLNLKDIDVKIIDKDFVVNGNASLTLNKLDVNIFSQYHLTANGKVELSVEDTKLKSAGIELALEEDINKENIISLDFAIKYTKSGDSSVDLKNFFNSLVVYKLKIGNDEYTSKAVKEFLLSPAILK